MITEYKNKKKKKKIKNPKIKKSQEGIQNNKNPIFY